MVARCTSWAYVAAVVLLTGVSTATAKYSGGTGEPNDPYQIATAADLIALGNEPSDYDKHFLLTADIDLDPKLPGGRVFDKAVIASDNDSNDTSGEFQGTPFMGVFDGNGRTISRLTITGGSYLGLFGHLWLRGQVRNLGVVDVNIVGSIYVGGLAGCNSLSGRITACYSTGTVSGTGWDVGGLVGYNVGSVTYCHSSASVSGASSVGGLVGENVGGGHIATSYSSGSASGTEYVGGLVGLNDRGKVDYFGPAAVAQCYSTSIVHGSEGVGGLVGCNAAFVANCWSSGEVSATGNDVGGLVGVNTGESRSGIVSDSFWDSEASGQAKSDGGTGKTTSEMQDPNTFMAAGWDFVGQPDGPDDIWAVPDGGGYPILWWQLLAWPELPRFSGGSGNSDDPYLISTPEQLNRIGCNPRLMSCHFRLVADLDLTGLEFYPIGNSTFEFYWTGDSRCYEGVFDGNAHTISHLTVMGKDHVGLFGVLGSGAEVKDFGLVDVNIAGSGQYVGGLAGSNRGTLSRCYSTGVVNGTYEVGGLVGENVGGTVTHCYSAAEVAGGNTVGGLVGSNWGPVTQCYSSGAVSGPEWVGGLVGYDHDHRATDCFWDTQTSGQRISDGGTGKTTTEMQTPSTFLDAGWDFVGETANGTEEVWKIAEGLDYPRLWWETTEE